MSGTSATAHGERGDHRRTPNTRRKAISPPSSRSSTPRRSSATVRRIDRPVFVKNPPVAGRRSAPSSPPARPTPSTARRRPRAMVDRPQQWDFGDGTTGRGDVVTHAFAEPGHLHRHATPSSTTPAIPATPPPRNSRSASTPSRLPPPGHDRRISIGEETVFDAGASSDSDGTIVTYEWDFGDGATAHRRDGPAQLCQAGHLYRHAPHPRQFRRRQQRRRAIP